MPQLDTLTEALDWLAEVFEPRVPPSNIHHTKLVADGDMLGTPEMTARFLRYVDAKPDDQWRGTGTQECQHGGLEPEVCGRCEGRGTVEVAAGEFKTPFWRALDKLSTIESDRWGEHQVRPEHPTPAQVILQVVRSGFYEIPPKLTFRDGHPIPGDFAAVMALSAIRKLHSRYSTGYSRIVPYSEMSESQRNAIDAA